jgi:hypothetical protein
VRKKLLRMLSGSTRHISERNPTWIRTETCTETHTHTFQIFWFTFSRKSIPRTSILRTCRKQQRAAASSFEGLRRDIFTLVISKLHAQQSDGTPVGYWSDDDEETDISDVKSGNGESNTTKGHAPTRNGSKFTPLDDELKAEDDDESDGDGWADNFGLDGKPRYKGDMRLADGKRRALGQTTLKELLFFCPSQKDLLEKDYYKSQYQKTDSEVATRREIMRYWKRTVTQRMTRRQV